MEQLDKTMKIYRDMVDHSDKVINEGIKGFVTGHGYDEVKGKFIIVEQRNGRVAKVFIKETVFI